MSESNINFNNEFIHANVSVNIKVKPTRLYKEQLPPPYCVRFTNEERNQINALASYYKISRTLLMRQIISSFCRSVNDGRINQS